MPLTIKDKKQIFQGKFIKVWQTIFLDKAGQERVWEWLEKKNFTMIFAITKDKKIVLIKNYRVPVENYIIELPGGIIDPTDKNSEAAAQRELLEETGYAAKNFYPLPINYNNPGITNNLVYSFIATEAERIAENSGDITEDIEVLEIPADDLFKQLSSEKYSSFDLRIFAFYAFAKEKRLL